MNSISSNRPSSRVITSLSVAVVAVLTVALTGFARGNQGHVGGELTIGNISLSGHSNDEIRNLMKQFADEKDRVEFILRLPIESGLKKRWKISARDLGLGIDIEKSLTLNESAQDNGLLNTLKSWVNHSPATHALLSTTVNQEVLDSVLNQLKKSVGRPARNAQFIILSKGGFATKHEHPGLSIDTGSSSKTIITAWSNFIQDTPAAPTVQSAAPSTSGTFAISPSDSSYSTTTSSGQNPIEITLTTTLTKPEITSSELSKIDGEIGEYSTRFGGTGKSRGRNIELATEKINGTILKPGEIFSYNKTVGPRVESAGFENAPVIIHGELVPGVGGGICQVSSTLYNAVLLSDLKIVNRSHHAFPVHYLPAGRDATVVDGAIDFKFQNNTPVPIYISATSRHGRLRFRLFGKYTRGREVSIQLEEHTLQPVWLEKIVDQNLPAGSIRIKDKGHKGHRLKVYRVVKDNGIVMQHEFISRDHYKPFPKIVIVGTRTMRGSNGLTISPVPQSASPTGQQILQ